MLEHRAVVMVGAFLLLIGSIMAYGVLGRGSEFFPESIPPSSISVRVDVPSGTAATFTDDLARRVEERLRDDAGMRDAESVVSTVSEGSGGGFMGASAEGSVTVNFIEFDKRQRRRFRNPARHAGRRGRGHGGRRDPG
jgi:multidrug efflux pump